jgi:hypothetical protein
MTKPRYPVPFLTREQIEAHKRAMRRTELVIWLASVPVILFVLWFAVH